MATGKKSFVAYADWKNTFDELPNEEAGALIKHIFAYVNDENPVSDSILIKAIFANIKATLKRDLDKWESQLNQRSEAGKRSAELRALNKINESSTVVEVRARNPTVSVSVNDNVSVKEINNNNINTRKLKFAQSLIPFVSIYGNDLIRNFCDYWSEPNKSNTKFRQELQKTWDTDRRLKTWNQNNFGNNTNNKKQTQDELTKLANEIRNREI
jgi:hypothetical protein